jgi:hypothetical protein
MRGKIKLVSVVLFAMLMLGFASVVNAQAVYTVSSNPNEVTHYGVTEVMGRVQLSQTNTGTTVGSQITVTYQGVTIKNASSTATNVGDVTVPGSGAAPGGITVAGAGGWAGTIAGLTFTSVSSTGTGGQVIISIPNTITGSGNPNVDFLVIDGVRADVSTKALATDIQASLSSSPSTANTFLNVSVVRVATINESLVLTAKSGSVAICSATTSAANSIKIHEGSAGVFVQYVTSAAGTAVPPDAREKFGAKNNTQVNIVLSTLPAGTTITWPATVASDVAGAGSLELISQSASGDAALYDFSTASQAISDANVESFTFDSTNVTVNIDPTTAVPGTATIQIQLYPPNPTSGSLGVPRFNHPLINSPADSIIGVNKCTTNLLFTFLTNATGIGFDSGMAIANTTMDPYGTAAQSGPITIYFYGTNAPAPLTTPDVAAGTVWANSLSTIAPGFQGYAIAVAQFQYAHGYAFITGKYNPGSVYDVAEGYIAIVIPDPTQTGGTRLAGPPVQNNLFVPPASGEQLGQ